MKAAGECSAVPIPSPFHMELQAPDIQVMLSYLPSARARTAKGSGRELPARGKTLKMKTVMRMRRKRRKKK